ncbi:hypothetical protein SK128_027628 [Halocaridina rubra]|uniref:DNA/RNA-binding protein Alba-like domain-containing protein n=1 Tax=Halocaridina rubra TaxID=373956 RepID=A0AAN8X0A8_HALRR
MATAISDQAKSASSSGKPEKGGSVVPVDPAEQCVRRLLPKFLPRNVNHIYVIPTTNFKNQFDRARSLLRNEGDYIIIHGLGVAVEKGINLTLKIKNALPELSLTTQTSGFHANEELALEVTADGQARYINVVHMKLMKPVTDNV